MKKLLSILAVAFFIAGLSAQSPEKISYQAIVRNTKGALVVNQTVGMKISIQKWVFAIPKPYYSTIYAETQTPVSNENGLISIAIGTGTVVSGSVSFADIKWESETYYLRTDIDITGGTAYSISSVTQLLSVPYAFHSKTAIKSETAKSAGIADTAKSVLTHYSGKSNFRFGIYPFRTVYPYTVPLRISCTEMGLTESDMYKFHIISMEVGWSEASTAGGTKQIRGPKDGIYYEICYLISGFAGVKIYFPDKQEYQDRDGNIVYVIIE